MNQKYKHMLKVMAQKEKSKRRKRREKPWFLYILECNDKTFYTGVTNNLERRLKMHNAGRASRYTRTRTPVKLLYHEICKNRTQALICECAVKAFPKKRKAALAHSNSEKNVV